jgi:hypothetical protein
MRRIGVLKPVVILGIALVGLAIGLTAAGPLSPRQEPVKVAPVVTQVEVSACVVDGAQTFTIEGGAGSALVPAAAGGCKACKAQPWCGCTYQGHPRISCDPCCYQAYPYPICLS